jgi:hypothetical protein
LRLPATALATAGGVLDEAISHCYNNPSTLEKEPSMKRVYVFDADDTLWMNEWQYSKAAAAFFNFLYEICGKYAPNLHATKDTFYELDKKNFETWGVRRGRVVESMRMFYYKIRDQILKRFNHDIFHEGHLRVIENMGDEPFNFHYLEWLPEMRVVLGRLKEKGDTLCLLSSYDKKTFPERIKFMKTEEFFPPCRTRSIEFRKTREDFIVVSGWTVEKDAECQWIAVGNGESDILPAVGISERWHGIYIPHPSTSAYVGSQKGTDHFNPPPLNHPRIKTILSARDFPYDFP